MFHLHIDTRSDGQPILTIGISHSSHLRYDLLDFRILILYFHLVQPTLKFRLCPGVLHHFPCLNRPLFRNTLQLHIAGYLIHHADQSSLEMSLSERYEVLQFRNHLLLYTSLPIPYQPFPVLSFGSADRGMQPISISIMNFSIMISLNRLLPEKPEEESFVESIIPMLLINLVKQGSPNLFVHPTEGSPVEHIISPMTFRPGSLSLESHVVNTFHDEFSYSLIENLALDSAVNHLALEFLHLFTCLCNSNFQGKEVNQIILERIFLQIPRHNCTCRIRNFHLSRLAEIIQHLQVELGFYQVLIGLIFHFSIRYSAKMRAALSTFAAQGRDL